MRTGIPYAYFLTFATYGSHLPGGSSPSTSRDQNAYGQPHIGPRPALESAARALMPYEDVVLDAVQRLLVEAAIREHCEFKGWVLHALNVRTNHVHVVVTAESETPDAVLRHFKSWATRKMRESGAIDGDIRPWARGGSTRYAWSEQDVVEMVDYVLFRQGAALT